MKPRVTMITLGVDDLERTLRFYRDGLGFQTQSIVGAEFEHGAVAFFDLQQGVKLAIWARKDLAHESKVPLGPHSATEFSLGHNVASKAEVDAVMEKAKQAGARITDPPHDTFWGGYAGSFQDPDGHLWEIAWNPEMDIVDWPGVAARVTEPDTSPLGATRTCATSVRRSVFPTVASYSLAYTNRVELEQEEDGRRIGAVRKLPGVMA